MSLFDFLKKKEHIKDENFDNMYKKDNIIDNSPINDDKIVGQNSVSDEILVKQQEVVEEEILGIVVEEPLGELTEQLSEEMEEESYKEQKTQEQAKKEGFFKKMFEGLDKTRKNILLGVENVLKSFTKIDEEMFEELEDVLIMADIGIATSAKIIEDVKLRIYKEKIDDINMVKKLLIDEISALLDSGDSGLDIKYPAVILIIGVNGVGKTTTIGKLANNYKNMGKSVMLVAADTFRAAAIDQLEIWGQRSGADTIKHRENSDPGAVVFDGIQAAKARKTDVLICDTAGRLHNKKNLMEELRKIYKIISKNYNTAHLETFLVLDATSGQNALQQAKTFKEVADITGIVLTKLDGTAKGGIVIAIKNELNIPVRFIGVGEGMDDLQQFNSGDFAKALFGQK